MKSAKGTWREGSVIAQKSQFAPGRWITDRLEDPFTNGAEPASLSFRGLVFDMDGVLLLSHNAHRRAFEEVLAPFGIHQFDYERYTGWRTLEVFRSVFLKALEQPPGKDIIAECALRKSALARQLLAQENPVAPDCVSVIQRLSLRYSLALASSGSRESVWAFLDRNGLRGSFHAIFSGDDVQRGKPDPEIFSRSILALGLPPRSCAVIEDAVAGIQAARLAGAKAIGIGGDRDTLIAAGADYLVSSLSELEQVLCDSRKQSAP